MGSSALPRSDLTLGQISRGPASHRAIICADAPALRNAIGHFSRLAESQLRCDYYQIMTDYTCYGQV